MRQVIHGIYEADKKGSTPLQQKKDQVAEKSTNDNIDK